jgi:uncharacterized membrane protein
MGVSTHSIEVNALLKAVYNQWTQFEESPHFMEGVEEVRQEGKKRLFWKAKIAGRVKEWEAEITNQVPDQRIAWESIDGIPNTLPSDSSVSSLRIGLIESPSAVITASASLPADAIASIS